MARFDLVPNRSPEEARRVGRYVLAGDERVDVLIARSVSTIDGARVFFDDVWARHREVWLDDHVRVRIPTLDDLIATKRFGSRPKDAEDVRRPRRHGWHERCGGCGGRWVTSSRKRKFPVRQLELLRAGGDE